MAIRIGVVRETFPDERRVALTPTTAELLIKSSFECVVESGAGVAAGYLDAEYEQRGTKVVSREEALRADVLLQVRTYGSNPQGSPSELPYLREGQVLVGFADPLTSLEEMECLAVRGVHLFAVELIPRTTRAQSMDALSSMANLAGYKAALLAASMHTHVFPMMTTAAGTVSPAKVLILGAGVAGLQAIATARRLGSVVSAYDVRSAVKEQVESLGAKFVVLDLESAEGKGGYAAEQSAEFLQRQQDLLGDVLSEQHAVITTAAIPGKRAPILITRAMVERMQPGSVIVDIAAERGGNCELTLPGETIVHSNGVVIAGPLNLASTLAYHASQLYARNLVNFVKNLFKKTGELNSEDEIVRESLVCAMGSVVHPRVAGLIGERHASSAV